MADKVYEPEVIADQNFPYVDSAAFSVSQSTTSGQYGPQTIKDQPMPVKRVAVELLSTVLNTKSKKILQEIQFTESGALQIGKYVDGVSGDVRISPNGIVARDIAGNTTIALDGSTGSAVFAGEIRSGTLITGTVTVGDSSVVIDGDSRNIVVNDLTNDRVLIGQW